MSTILIVDDEIISRELIGETLKREDHKILQASNGQEALALLATLSPLPDLIICDVIMPELDGHGLIKALQTYPTLATIPVILLSTLGTNQDFRRAMSAGADDYLIKPFKQDELIAAVNCRLQKKARLLAFYQSLHPSSLPHSSQDKGANLSTLTPAEMNLWQALEKALVNNEIYLNYQPQRTISSHSLMGCEVLMRWRHPQQGTISPSIFIPLAEKVGFINQLGAWLIQSVLQQCHQWQLSGLPSIRVGINISARQFEDNGFLDTLKSGVEKYNLSSEQLEMELTETLLVEDVEALIRQLQTLRNQGFRIALDDFGTGYSSLSYLQHFPFDVLKIDQSFVRNLNQNFKNKVITASMINLAHQLGLQVIAEGVETWEEYYTLADLGCDELQGYLFSRPLSTKDFTELLRQELGSCTQR